MQILHRSYRTPSRPAVRLALAMAFFHRAVAFATWQSIRDLSGWRPCLLASFMTEPDRSAALPLSKVGACCDTHCAKTLCPASCGLGYFQQLESDSASFNSEPGNGLYAGDPCKLVSCRPSSSVWSTVMLTKSRSGLSSKPTSPSAVVIFPTIRFPSFTF